MNGNFVFDLDGAIAIVAAYDREKIENGIKGKSLVKVFNIQVSIALSITQMVWKY